MRLASFIIVTVVGMALAIATFRSTPTATAAPVASHVLTLPQWQRDDGGNGFGVFEVFAFPQGRPDLGRKVSWDAKQYLDTAEELGIVEHIARPGMILVLTVVGELDGMTGPLELAVYPSATQEMFWIPEPVEGNFKPIDWEFVDVRFE